LFVWFSWPFQRPLPSGGSPPLLSDTPQLAAAEISFIDFSKLHEMHARETNK